MVVAFAMIGWSENELSYTSKKENAVLYLFIERRGRRKRGRRAIVLVI